MAWRTWAVRSGEEVILGAPVISKRALPHFPPSEPLQFPDRRFHIFLSHVWRSAAPSNNATLLPALSLARARPPCRCAVPSRSGQDQMRICKQRLVEMMPDCEVFLEYPNNGSYRGRAQPC